MKLDVNALVGQLQDLETFRELNWEGTFQEYVDLVLEDPLVTRTSYQRLYDMTVCVDRLQVANWIVLKGPVGIGQQRMPWFIQDLILAVLPHDAEAVVAQRGEPAGLDRGPGRDPPRPRGPASPL